MTRDFVKISKVRQLLENSLHFAEDCGAVAIFDNKGTLLALKSQDIALFAAPSLLQESFQKYLLPFKKGDVYISNDPYSGGVALHQLLMCIPVFPAAGASEPSFFVSSIKTYPALDHSSRLEKTPDTIDKEGVRIPPTRFHENGKMNEQLVEFLKSQLEFSASQFNQQLEGLKQIARILQKAESSLGKQNLDSSLRALLEISEESARRFLGDTPDVDCEFSDFLDDDGLGAQNIKLELKVSLQENTLGFDFNGTSKQTPGFINIPHAAVLGACWASLYFLSDGSLPLNGGTFKTVLLLTPEGSIVGPRFPAPVRCGALIGTARILDLIFGALSKALPFKIPAPGYGGDTLLRFEFKSSSLEEFLPGGSGSSKEFRGADGIFYYRQDSHILGVEETEKKFPLRVQHSHIRHNSGGKGRYSAGHGITRSYKLLEDAKISVLLDRHMSKPFGLYGGVPGLPAEAFGHRPGQKPKPLPFKGSIKLQAQDVVIINTAGGGGWGKPQNEPSS